MAYTAGCGFFFLTHGLLYGILFTVTATASWLYRQALQLNVLCNRIKGKISAGQHCRA